jgi:hypothetical protein
MSSRDYQAGERSRLEVFFSVVDWMVASLNSVSTGPEEDIAAKLQVTFLQSSLGSLQALVGLLEDGFIEDASALAQGLFEMSVASKYIESSNEFAREFLAAESAHSGTAFFHMAAKSLAERHSREEGGESVEVERFYIMSSYRFTHSMRLGCPPVTYLLTNEEKTLTVDQLDSITGLLLYIASVSVTSVAKVLLEAPGVSVDFSADDLREKDEEIVRLSKELQSEVGQIPFETSPQTDVVNAHVERFESVSFARTADAFLSGQLKLMGCLADEISKIDRADVLSPLLITGARSGKALVSLSRGGFVQDALIVARGFFERLLNACYLAVADDEVVKSYRNHGLQKSFRTRNREVEAGDVKVAIRTVEEMDPSDVPGLEEALDEFTSKRGKEKTRWTQTRAEGRISLIQERTSVDTIILVLALLSIYEDASEAIHGTLYGSIFDLLHIPSVGDEVAPSDVKDHSRTQIVSSMILCGLSVGCLAEVFVEVFDIGDSVADQFHRNREKFASHLKRTMEKT